MSLFEAVLAIIVFMFFQDVFGTGLSISEPRGLKFFPGFFDGMGDFVNKYGGAVTAVTAVRYSLLSWQLFLVVLACAVTSFFTSNMATAKESKILPTSAMEEITLSGMWRRIKDAF